MSAETDWEAAQAEDLAIEGAIEDARDPYRGEEPPDEDPDFMEAVARIDFIGHDGNGLFRLKCDHADRYELYTTDGQYLAELRRVYAQPPATVWEIGDGSDADWPRSDHPFELAAMWVTDLAVAERRRLDLADADNDAAVGYDEESPF